MEGKSPVEVKEEVQKRNYMRSLIKDLKNAEKGFMANLRVSSMPTRSEESSSLARRLKKEDSKGYYTKQRLTYYFSVCEKTIYEGSDAFTRDKETDDEETQKFTGTGFDPCL